jgi:hypothetical protein
VEQNRALTHKTRITRPAGRVRNGLQSPLPSRPHCWAFAFVNNREIDQAAPRAPHARPVQGESTRSDAPDSGKKPRADRPRCLARELAGRRGYFEFAKLLHSRANVGRGGCAPSPRSSGRTTRFAELTSRGVTLPRKPPQAARSLTAKQQPPLWRSPSRIPPSARLVAIPHTPQAINPPN